MGDIAKVGLKLLNDRKAAKQGLEALKKHNRQAFNHWKLFLD